jgi:preprotein translocase subunit SecA
VDEQSQRRPQGALTAVAAAAAGMARVGRNDPCPCGSGKKFKLCHGRLT